MTCPECSSEQPEQAKVCAACGRQIVGKPCPECAEIVKTEAAKCRYCGHSFARAMKVAGIEAFSVQAARLPTFLCRGRLIPERIHLSSEKIRIQTWGFLGLSRTDEDIPWEKVAGFHYHSGWFWDHVEIQTRGQKANAIGCLPKNEGARIRQALEQMKE